MKTIVLPSARADILRQIDYFVEIGQSLVADRFLAAARAAIDHISHTPQAGAPRSVKNRRLAGLRTWPIDGFDDLKIYYLVSPDDVTIVRILHGRRDIARILEA